MKAPRLRPLSLLLLGGCVGCASAPIHYYTLSAPETTSVSGNRATIAIDVHVARLPAQLQRSELMVRSGPTEVTLLENERWASPLSDEIKDAVQAALRDRLSRPSDSAPWRTAGKLSVTLDINRLEVQLGRTVSLDTTWIARVRFEEPNESIVKSCRFHALDAIADGYTEMVQGYQRELTALAAAIISELDTPGHFRCDPSPQQN